MEQVEKFEKDMSRSEGVARGAVAVCNGDAKVLSDSIEAVAGEVWKQAARERDRAEVRIRHTSFRIKARNFVVDETHVERCIVGDEHCAAREIEPRTGEVCEARGIAHHTICDASQS